MEIHSSSMGSIWPMDGRFPLTCMARHGTSRATEWSEPYFILFFFCTFWDSVKLPNSFGLSFLSFTWFMSSLTLCFLRQSQSSGWMGGFGSQSAQAAAPQGPVVSNLGNYNMAGYQTQWARCNTKGVFLVCFLFGQLLWYKKGRGCIHKAFLTASFSTTGLSLQLYFTQQNYFTLNFLILYI